MASATFTTELSFHWWPQHIVDAPKISWSSFRHCLSSDDDGLSQLSVWEVLIPSVVRRLFLDLLVLQTWGWASLDVIHFSLLTLPPPQKTKLSVQVLHHFSTGALLPIWGLFESLYSLYSAARRSCVFADNQCNHRVLQKITVSQKSLFFFFYSAAVWTKVQSSAHCLRFTDTGWKQYRWFFSKNKILTQFSLPGSLWRFVLPPSLERTLQVGQW